MLIRPACAQDAPAVSDIYAHYARATAITFAESAPTPEEYAARIADRRYPFLIAQDESGVAGFAYADEFRTKAAYRWDVEATIYLRPDCQGRGAGTLLMNALLDALTRQGYLNVYSCITVPNEASVRLHRRCGFTALGEFPATGYKLGRWHSVVWMQRVLGPLGDPPREPQMRE